MILSKNEKVAASRGRSGGRQLRVVAGQIRVEPSQKICIGRWQSNPSQILSFFFGFSNSFDHSQCSQDPRPWSAESLVPVPAVPGPQQH